MFVATRCPSTPGALIRPLYQPGPCRCCPQAKAGLSYLSPPPKLEGACQSQLRVESPAPVQIWPHQLISASQQHADLFMRPDGIRHSRLDSAFTIGSSRKSFKPFPTLIARRARTFAGFDATGSLRTRLREVCTPQLQFACIGFELQQ